MNKLIQSGLLHQAADIERALERLLNDARKGKLTGAVFAVKYSVWHHGVWVVGDYVDSPADALDATSRLAQALAEFREANTKPQPVAESVGMLYQLIRQPDGRATMPFCTDAVRRIFRLSPEDVLEDATRIESVIHPDDLPGLIESVTAAMASGGFWQGKYRTLFPDGTGAALMAKADITKLPDGSVQFNGVIVEQSP